jgi:hypothetical protein
MAHNIRGQSQTSGMVIGGNGFFQFYFKLANLFVKLKKLLI